MEKKDRLKCDVKKIAAILKGLTEVEWSFLNSCMDVAGVIREMRRKYGVDDKWLMAELELDARKLKLWEIGAHNYSLTDVVKINMAMSKLQVAYAYEYPPIQIPPKERKKRSAD